MALEAKGRNSEHTSLKPFTYPVPETRFIHAGVSVYKFQIKYGNTVSPNGDLHENIVNRELEEAIRVILGNLNNLHPFTTEHLVMFPYLSKWEKASDLRFKLGSVYVDSGNVCLDLTGSWISLSFHMPFYATPLILLIGVIVPSKLFYTRDEIKQNMGIPVTLNVARDATCIYGTIGPRVERTRLHKGVIHPTENLPEEILYQFCGAPIVNRGYDNITSGEHVEYDVAENPDHKQLDGQAPVLPQGPEEHTEWKKRGFLALLKSTLFPPLLQHIFTRISQPS